MNRMMPTITVEEGCSRVLTWNNNFETIHIGVYIIKDIRRGYFIASDQTGCYRRMWYAPWCLHGNLTLWHSIQRALHKMGICLMTVPPANSVGGPV